MKLRLKNDINEITRLGDEIEAFGSENGLNLDLVFTLNFILDEIVTNVIMYAYPKGTENYIDVVFILEGDFLIIQVIDEGKEFNPINAKTPNLTSDIDEREIGGLGIHLVKNMIESMEYKRENSKNILVLIKKVK